MEADRLYETKVVRCIKIYAFVFIHSRTLTARSHCALFRLSRPLIGFLSRPTKLFMLNTSWP